MGLLRFSFCGVCQSVLGNRAIWKSRCLVCGKFHCLIFILFQKKPQNAIKKWWKFPMNYKLKKTNSENLPCTLLSNRGVSLETWQLPAKVETPVNPWGQPCQQSTTTRQICTVRMCPFSPPSQASPASGYRRWKVLGQLHSLGFPWQQATDPWIWESEVS